MALERKCKNVKKLLKVPLDYRWHHILSARLFRNIPSAFTNNAFLAALGFLLCERLIKALRLAPSKSIVWLLYKELARRPRYTTQIKNYSSNTDYCKYWVFGTVHHSLYHREGTICVTGCGAKLLYYHPPKSMEEIMNEAIEGFFWTNLSLLTCCYLGDKQLLKCS